MPQISVSMLIDHKAKKYEDYFANSSEMITFAHEVDSQYNEKDNGKI